ncbi:hypothetical protein BH11PSE2_BH11PSE2_07050 [soil metagenome]
MSELEAEDTEAADTPPAKKKLPKLVLIGGAVGALVLIIAVVAAVLLMGKKKPEAAEEVHPAAVEESGPALDTAEQNALEAVAAARAAAEGTDLPEKPADAAPATHPAPALTPAAAAKH